MDCVPEESEEIIKKLLDLDPDLIPLPQQLQDIATRDKTADLHLKHPLKRFSGSIKVKRRNRFEAKEKYFSKIIFVKKRK